MAVSQEKILAHSRSRDQNLQRGWRFIQNGGYGEKSEKIWVRDMAKVMINKMVEKAEVFFYNRMFYSITQQGFTNIYKNIF